METKTIRRKAPAVNPAGAIRLTAALIAAEAAPFATAGTLADAVSGLAAALGAEGVDAYIVMPHYGGLMPAGMDLRMTGALDIPGPWTVKKAVVWRGALPGNGVPVYFIEAAAYFDRAGVYGDPGMDQGYGDTAERFAFFSRAAFEFLRTRPSPPDVIHLHDNHPAPLALMLRGPGAEPGPLSGAALVLTIHNLAFQGLYPRGEALRLGAPPEALEWGGALEFYGQANYLKGAIQLADRVTTVSPRYAEEIRTDPASGCGLEGVLAARGNQVTGILNGVDPAAWEPSSDSHLAAQYDRNRLAGKTACRKNLLERMGLPAANRRGRAVLGMVSRLVDQKGLDLVLEIAPELVKRNVQLAILGAGEPRIQDALTGLQRSHPAEVAVEFGVDENLAHRILAGADMYLMPSRSEPFGLQQIHALRYGTIPVVHATGGLADTVVDADASPREGTGFSFDRYTGEAFLAAIDRALLTYADARRWRTMVRRAMGADFGWAVSAAAYREVYEAARERAGAMAREECGLAAAGV